MNVLNVTDDCAKEINTLQIIDDENADIIIFLKLFTIINPRWCTINIS